MLRLRSPLPSALSLVLLSSLTACSEAPQWTGSVQTRAAELLGMTFRSFRYFAKKYSLNAKEQGAERYDEEQDSPRTVIAGGSN